MAAERFDCLNLSTTERIVLLAAFRAAEGMTEDTSLPFGGPGVEHAVDELVRLMLLWREEDGSLACTNLGGLVARVAFMYSDAAHQDDD